MVFPWPRPLSKEEIEEEKEKCKADKEECEKRIRR
jgi:hypothetical protein